MDDVRWYYEGRNGWWQYDDRTSSELETFHGRGDSNCELLIAGFLYIINFEQVGTIYIHIHMSSMERGKMDICALTAEIDQPRPIVLYMKSTACRCPFYPSL